MDHYNILFFVSIHAVITANTCTGTEIPSVVWISSTILGLPSHCNSSSMVMAESSLSRISIPEKYHVNKRKRKILYRNTQTEQQNKISTQPRRSVGSPKKHSSYNTFQWLVSSPFPQVAGAHPPPWPLPVSTVVPATTTQAVAAANPSIKAPGSNSPLSLFASVVPRSSGGATIV